MKFSAPLVALVALGSIAPAANCQPAPFVPKPYATRKKNVVTLVPSGFKFQVPWSWIEWNDKFHNNFHLTRAQIDKTAVAEGEWDKPSSKIVGEILSIEQCAVHAGGDGWGLDSVAFGDVQMRAYVAQWSVVHVQNLTRERGVAAASKFSKKVDFKTSVVGKWQVSQMSYYLDYGDYGGTAHIDIYACTIGRQSVALVFMYTDASEKKDIRTIVNSFK